MAGEFEALSAFYAHYDEQGRLEKRHGQVEFLTTVKYVERYLAPGMKILEIGAGTGRYSHYFARRGFSVDAVEFMPVNIGVFHKNTLPGEPVTVREGDARDLGDFAGEAYDVTLLLGPMYHLFTREDQEKALCEALRVTRTGGVIFAAYCMADASILQHGFMKGNVHSLIERGMLDPVTFAAHSEPGDVFELYTKAKIDALMEGLPVQRLHFVGADMAANYMRDALDGMDDETFDLFMRYHFTICERPELVGATHHSLDIFRKQS